MRFLFWIEQHGRRMVNVVNAVSSTPLNVTTRQTSHRVIHQNHSLSLRISDPNYLAHLLAATVTLRKDASFALHLSQINQVSHFGIFGEAMRSCSNLRQVLNLLLRYHLLIVGQAIRWELCELDDAVAVRRLQIQAAGNFPNINQVSKQLYMSKSKLGRRLENESNSFRIIIEEVKNLLAKEYLTNTELTVADIAHLLDYTDTAKFRRAFVRWNEMPPGEFRQET